MSLRVHEAQLDGQRVRWREEGSGRDVVMIPGLGLTGRFYENNAAAFAAAGFRFIVPDVPALGGTQGPRTGMSVSAISAFARGFIELLDIGSVCWMGHSLGAQIALHAAAHGPDRARALVLVGPTGAHTHRRPRLRHQAAGIVREAIRAPLPVIGAVARDYIRISPVAYIGTWLRGARDEPMRYAGDVRCPTLLTVGTRDPMAEQQFVERLAAQVPDARIAWIEGGGHALPRDSAIGFHAAVIAFLQACN